MYRNIAIVTVAAALSACGASAEEFAGLYNGELTLTMSIGQTNSTSAESRDLSFSAPTPDVMRMDDPDCPVEFEMTSDTNFSLSPRDCSGTANDGTRVTLHMKTGSLTVTDGRKISVSIRGTFTVTTNDGPVSGDMRWNFSGTRR